MNLCFLSEYQDVMKSFGDLMFMIIRALYCLSIIIIIPKIQLLLINGKKTVNSNKVPTWKEIQVLSHEISTGKEVIL